jgi:hypothetical protein
LFILQGATKSSQGARQICNPDEQAFDRLTKSELLLAIFFGGCDTKFKFTEKLLFP